MADNSGMIKLGLVAAVAYYAYTQGWLSALGIGTPAVAAAAAPAAPAAAAPAATPAAAAKAPPSLADLQAAVLLAAQAPAEGLTMDEWGWYLNNALAPSGHAAPDPWPLFRAAVPTIDRSQVLNAGQYWVIMAPALKSQTGLSGLGMYWRVN